MKQVNYYAWSPERGLRECSVHQDNSPKVEPGDYCAWWMHVSQRWQVDYYQKALSDGSGGWISLSIEQVPPEFRTLLLLVGVTL
jgi:hypothetical protein